MLGRAFVFSWSCVICGFEEVTSFESRFGFCFFRGSVRYLCVGLYVLGRTCFFSLIYVD